MFGESPDSSGNSARKDGAVPQWHDLPDYTQRELGACGYDADWFDQQSPSPALRLTVLNLYVKLKGLGLFRFVTTEQDSVTGCMNFTCSAVGVLKATLRERPDFTNPEQFTEGWSARERRAVGALHFKHFTGWPEDKVQVHIDPRGLLLRSLLWWLVPIIPLGLMLTHAVDRNGYAAVYKIRAMLLAQGWDDAPLIGQQR